MYPVRKYINELQQAIDNLPLETITEVVEILHYARLNSRQIFIMGNGGSASTASHFVCDLSKNTQRDGWSDFRVLGLSDNIALISAYANDECYENIFAKQLSSFVQPGDIIIGISTSGDSLNVIKAMELGKKINATTIAFTGPNGNRLSSLADVNILVSSDCTEQIEDIHLILQHLICLCLRHMAPTKRDIGRSAEMPLICSKCPEESKL